MVLRFLELAEGVIGETRRILKNDIDHSPLIEVEGVLEDGLSVLSI